MSDEQLKIKDREIERLVKQNQILKNALQLYKQESPLPTDVSGYYSYVIRLMVPSLKKAKEALEEVETI